jgi:hypothetical protein
LKFETCRDLSIGRAWKAQSIERAQTMFEVVFFIFGAFAGIAVTIAIGYAASGDLELR